MGRQHIRVQDHADGAQDMAIPLFMIFVMMLATNSNLLMQVEDSPIWHGRIPYDCAYLEGIVYEKVAFDEPINDQDYGLRVNVSVDNTTNYNIAMTVSELTYDLAEVNGTYRAYTCKMADIHEMIDQGIIWQLP